MSRDINNLLSRFGGLIETKGPLSVVNKDLQLDSSLININQKNLPGEENDPTADDKMNYWQRLIKDINNYKTKTIPSEISMDVVSLLNQQKEPKSCKSQGTKFVKKSELTSMMKSQLAHVLKDDNYTQRTTMQKHKYNKSFQVKSLDRAIDNKRSLSSTYLGQGQLSSFMTPGFPEEQVIAKGSSTLYQSSYLSNRKQWPSNVLNYRSAMSRTTQKMAHQSRVQGSLAVRQIDPSLHSESRFFGQTTGGPIFAQGSLTLRAGMDQPSAPHLPADIHRTEQGVVDQGPVFESKSQRHSSFLKDSKHSVPISQQSISLNASQPKLQIKPVENSKRSSLVSCGSQMIAK